jgi:hypothetical protein
MLPPGIQDQGPVSQVPGMTAPAPANPAAQLSDLFSMMSELSTRPKELPADKVKRALSLLDEARSEDEKLAPNLSMGIHVIKNGSDGIEKFTDESSKFKRGRHPIIY